MKRLINILFLSLLTSCAVTDQPTIEQKTYIITKDCKIPYTDTLDIPYIEGR